MGGDCEGERSDGGGGRGGCEVTVGKGKELIVDGTAEDEVGVSETVVEVDKVLDGLKCEVLEIGGESVGAYGVLEAVEELVVAVTGLVAGFLQVGAYLVGAAAEVGLEQLGGDEGLLEGFGYKGEELVGEFAEEVVGDVALAYVGRAFYYNAMEVEELGDVFGGVDGCGFAEELVGGVGLAFEGLIGTAGFEGDVKFDDADGVVGEEVEYVAVGQGVLLWDEGLD